MSWAKQNKFLAGYAAVTGGLFLVLAVLLFFSYSKWSTANEARIQADQDLTTLEDARPFPSPENVKEAKDRLAKDEAAAQELLTKIQEKYSAPLKEVSAGAWAQDLNKRIGDVKNSASVNDFKLFDDFYLGMRDYSSGTQPSKENLPELDFQVSALDALVSQLISSGNTELKYLGRGYLEGEPGYKEPETVRRRGSRAPAPPVEGPFKTYPVELVFETSSKGRGLDVFLRNIASHPRFFFSIRILRIENELQLPPSKGDSLKFATPEEKKMMDEAPKSDNPIFPKVRIRGREKLTVYALIDIVHFKSEEKKDADGNAATAAR